MNGNQLRERDEDGSMLPAISEIHLPPVSSAYEYLISLFSLSGQASSTGYGLSALSWLELKAFIEVNQLELTLYEVEILKKMSEAYCAEYHAASDPKRPAPYKPEVEEEEIDHIGNALRMREQVMLLRRQTD